MHPEIGDGKIYMEQPQIPQELPVAHNGTHPTPKQTAPEQVPHPQIPQELGDVYYGK